METPPMSNYPRGGGPGGGGNYAIPVRGPGVYFDYISVAWQMLTKNAAVFIGGGIVIWMINALIGYPAGFGLNAMLFGSPVGPKPGFKPEDIRFGLAPIAILLQSLLFGVQTALYSGISLAAIEQADTGAARFETLFSGFKNFWNLLIGSVLTMLCIYAGLLACLVPAVYVAGLLALTNMIVINEGLPALDAMKRSIAISKPYAWSIGAFMICSALVSLLGCCACGIGILVTMPMLYMTIGLMYRDFRPAPVSSW